MSTWKTGLLPVVLTITLLSAGSARADFVPWTYNWEPNVLAISAGTGGLSLTDEPFNHAVGNSDIVVTNIRAFSDSPRTKPDVLNHASFIFTLFLKDTASNQTATLNFGGFFSGTISSNSANVKATYMGPLMQKVILGGHTYAINLGAYSPPGPPSASNAGSISAHVAVDEFTPNGGGGGGGGSHEAPEPSTLVLSALGLSCIGLGGWRKLRLKGPA